MQAVRIGYSGDPETQMGPVATQAQYAKDQQMVERAVSEGARLLTGGRKATVSGFEQGFRDAQGILKGLGVLKGDIAAGIDRTYELVMTGYAEQIDSIARLGFPMAPKAWADEVMANLAKKAA